MCPKTTGRHTRPSKITMRTNYEINLQNGYNTGEEVLYYYKSTENEPKEWRPWIVKDVHDHNVEISYKKNGPHTKAAFEDIRLKPRQPLNEARIDYLIDEVNHQGEDDININATPDNYHESTAEVIDDAER